MPDEDHAPVRWDIGREGRSWSSTETLSKLGQLPGRLGQLGGKLCHSQEQRLELLAALLESLGMDEAVRLGSAELWRQAIERRLEVEADALARPDGQGQERALDQDAPSPGASSIDDHDPPPERHWNYRVMNFASGSKDRWSAIHEVYYERGRPIGYTQKPAAILWDAEAGLPAGAAILERMREALVKPALSEADFEERTTDAEHPPVDSDGTPAP